MQNSAGIKSTYRKKERRSKQYKACSDVVTRRGFEPRTHCLKGNCSAN